MKTLTNADRCDACGAQAYVRFRIGQGELFFCAHHARRHEARLAEVGTLEIDQRAQLTAQLTSVS